VPDDGLQSTTEPTLGFTTRVPGGNAGLIFFDVTYSDPALIPRLLAHEITLASPDGGAPSTPGLTNPVPVGCKALAVLSPPVAGQGWLAANGCCTVAAYHRDPDTPFNGTLGTLNHLAIDFEQLGPNNALVKGQVSDLAPGGATMHRSWPRPLAWSSRPWTGCQTRPCP
jgi:hypothetical protein